MSAWREMRHPRKSYPEPMLHARRLHGWSRAALRALDIEVHIEDSIPSSGLLVSNHLSYLDILVYSSALPCSFVSKAEVADWLIIGPFARFSGTIFIRR